MASTPLTHLVAFRLPAEKHFLYETEAAYRGQSLGVYLRERLERSDASSPDLQYVREFLENMSQPSSPETRGILLEILLLLRVIAGPEKMLLVQKELSRLNIPVWQGER